MAIKSTGLNVAGLRSEFFKRFDPADQAALFQRLCTRIPSTKDAETYRFLGQVPQVREWGTGRQAKGLGVESYSVENLKYEATLEVDRDEVSDDQTGQIMIRVNELGNRAATHKDYMLATLLENGAATGFNSYDGVTYFNAAHVSGASGNQDNDLTSAIVDKDDPTTAEFKAALRGAVAAMMAFKDDQDEPMFTSQAGLIVIVPPAVMFHAAREALNAAVIAQTSNVDAGMADLATLPWLTSTDTFYLCKNDAVVRPFIFQDREPIEFGEDKTREFVTEKTLYGVRARYRVTYGYWQYCVRHVFTTA